MVGIESLKRIIDQICRDKGIDRTLLVDAIEEAVRSAVRKKYASRRDIEVQFNEELGEIEVFQYRTVVDDVFDEETEISLEDARLLDSEIEMDDDLGEKLDNIADLGRIAAQSAKQVIIHRMRDAERDVIYDMFRDRQGTVVNGIVQRFERGNMVINLGRTDAILPRDGQIPKRSFKQGDRIRAFLQEVRHESRDAQLVLSRTCNEFLVKLFEVEVPEIAEGIVKIMGATREPGFRAKIAVSSIESDVDPVGACVGLKGSRVQNVVQELQGERIDIVPWSPDPAKYVYNALAPAEVTMVVVDEDRKSLLVVVPDDQLSLAIGRQGQNVRLASRLLSWRIDVKSEQRYANMENPSYQTLTVIEGVDEGMADRLFAAGITSSALLAALNDDQLMDIVRVDKDKAAAILEGAALVPVPEGIEEVVESDPETEQDSEGEVELAEEMQVAEGADSEEDVESEEETLVAEEVDSEEEAESEEETQIAEEAGPEEEVEPEEETQGAEEATSDLSVTGDTESGESEGETP